MDRRALGARLGGFFFATRVRVAVTCVVGLAVLAGLVAVAVIGHLTNGGMIARQKPGRGRGIHRNAPPGHEHPREVPGA